MLRRLVLCIRHSSLFCIAAILQLISLFRSTRLPKAVECCIVTITCGLHWGLIDCTASAPTLTFGCAPRTLLGQYWKVTWAVTCLRSAVFCSLGERGGVVDNHLDPLQYCRTPLCFNFVGHCACQCWHEQLHQLHGVNASSVVTLIHHLLRRHAPHL